MAIIAKGYGPSEQPEAGMHLARCIKVIDLGTQSDEFQGRVKHSRKIWIQWELLGSGMTGEYNPELKGKPFAMALSFTLSMHDKATLRKVLESWRGKPFTKEEVLSFDVSTVLGAPAYLNIGQNQSGDKMRISTVNPVPPALKKNIGKAKNPLVTLSLDPGDFDRVAYDSLSPKIQEWVASSPEFQRLMNNDPADDHGSGESESGHDPMDDAGF
jgi:hypothetical protein